MPSMNERIRRNGRTSDGGSRPGHQTARLRASFLAPVAVTIAAILALLVAQLFFHERAEIEHEVARIRTALDKMYLDDLAHNRAMLHAVMEVIQLDSSLYRALARKDRAELMTRTGPLFPRLKEKFHITQFYFSGPDRVNLLRVHRLGRYGDVIDRYTMLDAERTGVMARGVELGPDGILTLRMVHPWHLAPAQNLIGYFELGMEIDHILGTVQEFLGVPVVVLVSKQYLDRAAWEAGTRERGRASQWERFPETVLSFQAVHAVSPAIVTALAGFPAATPDAVLEATQGSERYRLTAAPLRDAAGRTVAWMVAVIDVSRHSEIARRAMWVGAAFAFIGGGTLFVFFWWLVGRIGRRLERDERELEQLATHDGLTGLYSHRMFHVLLEEERARNDRFGRQLSLLMLDIDHFKRVNDTHGHQAGDLILKGLSDLLNRQARAIDRVCRYGGEEITLLLPETDANGAANIAERLRAAVEREAFDVGNGRTIPITVSIGIASYPLDADSTEKLIAAADAAMYVAKQAGRNRVERYKAAVSN